MSVHMIYYKDGEKAKYLRPVTTREEYLKIRGSEQQRLTVKAVRRGDEAQKHRLIQMNYSCLPGDDGHLKGTTRMSNTVGMDIDHLQPKEMARVRKRILTKKDELGLLMLERSARGRGYHLVFRRRPELSQEENLMWASGLLEVEFDKGAKDITRVFYTTTASPQDLIYLDDEIFRPTPEPLPVMEGSGYTQGDKTEAEQSTPLPRREGTGESPESLAFKGRPYSDIIDAWWKRNGGVPQEGERNVKLYQLAVNLRAICDNNRQLLMQVMPRLGLDEQELRAIVDSACKEPPKGISKMLAGILAMDDGRSQKEDGERKDNSQFSILQPEGRSVARNLNSQLEDWGAQIEAMFDDFPILKDICKGLKRNQYPAALIVSGAFEMTLMTRCWYRFYHRPEEVRRLNSSALIIGDPASGKSFATRLFKLLAAPIVAADKAGRDAINAYREQMRTKGANKEKPKKPKVVVRIHPARTSNAQFIQDMVNAVELVDGEEMHLHMLTFDTELDNTVTVQKGGSWIDKQSLELKAFHNEEDGQAYSNMDSILQDFNVYWNYVYTGTPIALKKKVNEQNFGSGLATRLTCIPLPATNFQMMTRESTVDYESDARIKAWAEKLDRMKGELSVQKIVDELYDWTARRMADAQENDSRADEMLLKRCAYHGLNFSAPFIVMRHWDQLHQDGDYWCGEFETDEVDWKLAELITNIQYACQRHYFGAMAEAYFDNKLRDASVNVRRQQKTIEGFNRLPEEFTTEDVMRCFGLASDSSARTRVSRLLADKLAVKTGDYTENGTTKSKFRKTGAIML